MKPNRPGKPGPKPKLGARSRVLTLRTDDAMEEALAEDLAQLQAANPNATQSDVVRSWSRGASRPRRVAHDARMAAELRALAKQAKEFEERASRAERLVIAYEEKEAKTRSKAITAALNTLRKPGNHHVRQQLGELVKLEASGLVANSANPTLATARREAGSWKALQEIVDDVGERGGVGAGPPEPGGGS